MGKQFASQQGQQGQQAKRTKIVAQRITGKLTEWKGNYGWIQPSEPIKHEAAKQNKGRIYLGKEDVEADLEGVGTVVSFFVYTDGKGLGAMSCRPHHGKEVQKAITKHPQQAAKPQQAQQAAKPQQAQKGWHQRTAPPKAAQKWSPSAAKQAAPSQNGKAQTMNQAPPNKNQRQAVVTVPISGTVKQATGKVAFIQPDEPVKHAHASKNGGRIYLHADDMDEGQEFPRVGATVMFFVYADKQQHRLGAQFCNLVDQAEEEGNGDDMEGVEEEGEAAEEEAEDAGAAEEEAEDTAEDIIDLDDDEEEEAPAKPARPVSKGKSKGDGKSKGEGQSKGDGKSKGAGKGKTGGKGKAAQQKGGKQKAPEAGSREVFSDGPVVGTVTAWKGMFGWVEPDEPVDHPDQKKRSGIYVQKSDVDPDLKMSPGMRVQMELYLDSRGLGGQSVFAYEDE